MFKKKSAKPEPKKAVKKPQAPVKVSSTDVGPNPLGEDITPPMGTPTPGPGPASPIEQNLPVAKPTVPVVLPTESHIVSIPPVTTPPAKPRKLVSLAHFLNSKIAK